MVSSNILPLRERPATKSSIHLSMYSHPHYAQPQTDTLLQTPRDTLSHTHTATETYTLTVTHIHVHPQTHMYTQTFTYLHTHVISSSAHTQRHMTPPTLHTPVFVCYLVGLSLIVVLFPRASEGHGRTNDLHRTSLIPTPSLQKPTATRVHKAVHLRVIGRR